MRISDWSSDVCSSDLQARNTDSVRERAAEGRSGSGGGRLDPLAGAELHDDGTRTPAIGGEGGRSRGHAGRSRPRGDPMPRDRKSVVKGKSVSVRVDLGGRRIIKNKKRHKKSRY